jgi:hypothetical protein
MSIRNRYLTEKGPFNLTVLYESKFQTRIGKVYCAFAGHKPIRLITDTVNSDYCICCWKKLR